MDCASGLRMGMTVLLLAGPALAGADVPAAAPPIDPMSASMFQQIQVSGKLYFHARIAPPLQQLNDVERSIAQHPSSPMGAHLDFGLQQDDPIIQAMLRGGGGGMGLIPFQQSHNARLDEWMAKNPRIGGMVDRLRLRAELIREIREQISREAWPHVTAHWYSNPEGWQWRDHDIPKVGVQLDPVSFGRSAQGAIREYAMLLFLRRLCRQEQPDELSRFLQTQTGQREFTTTKTTPFSLKRWHFADYYAYQCIGPHNRQSLETDSPAAWVADEYVWGGSSHDPAQHYQRKLQMFRNLAAEMSRADSLQATAWPYWGLYNVLCRSVPCISAFKWRSGGPKQKPGWVDGYDDRPAARQFASDSPVGLAWSVYRQLCGSGANPTLAQRLFSPILLVQLELTTTAGELGPDVYRDLKVGYTGYLDFYQDLISTNSVLAPAMGEAKP